MASEFFDRQRECRFYTAGCGNKMAVSVTGPRAVNQLSGPVIIISKYYVTLVSGTITSHLFLYHSYFMI